MKCRLCGERYRRIFKCCPRCGFGASGSRRVREEDWEAGFEMVDRAGETFDLWCFLATNNAPQKANAPGAIASAGPISGTVPDCSGVLGDYCQVVRPQKKKRTRRLKKQRLRVRREFLVPDDGYYDDVLPEDWAEISKRERFDLKKFSLRFGAAFGAVLVSGFFLMLALLI